MNLRLVRQDFFLQTRQHVATYAPSLLFDAMHNKNHKWVMHTRVSLSNKGSTIWIEVSKKGIWLCINIQINKYIHLTHEEPKSLLINGENHCATHRSTGKRKRKEDWSITHREQRRSDLLLFMLILDHKKDEQQEKESNRHQVKRKSNWKIRSEREWKARSTSTSGSAISVLPPAVFPSLSTLLNKCEMLLSAAALL